MSLWVVDASAAVEMLLRTDVGTSAWLTLGNGDAVAPDLIDAEVLSVIRREHLRGRISLGRAEQALADLAAWDLERIRGTSLLDTAWVFRHNVSAYDALYVAAAVRTGGTVLTADGPLSRAPGLGITIQNIRT